ncbi:pyridoxal-phosphate dependent enzyme [Couchioplanes azureus]|uniref:pyridoxal-phosphate dependent enzyme n=1 Tax=Couchioplanes caeruleus TaxID=56438 RepID=UPI00166FBEC5|nr:pyridoxal-phosphate dependent enzyme [Couchioplanes caeruleus]GGQ49579.1 D-cysteine desulfhydrase [Couchioplanes caeruleus subsp. azureus]
MTVPLLHERFPAIVGRLPFRRLGTAPTPVRAVAGLGGVWVKDDGGYGTLYGGNKVRKLEWTLADLLSRGRRTVVTAGGTGSHHAVAVARYATAAGLRVAVVALEQPYDEHVARQAAAVHATGATVRRVGSVPAGYLAAGLLLARAAVTGARPSLLPVGGSSPRGCLGYVEAALELAAQVAAGELPVPRQVVVPVGSGGTAAGLALGLGLAGLPTRVVGVLVNDRTPMGEPQVRRLAEATARLLRRSGAPLPERAPLAPLTVRADWLGPGYGHPTAASAAAAPWLTEHAGVRTEPVYTAKAAAALRELAGAGPAQGPVLYWHTADEGNRAETPTQ